MKIKLDDMDIIQIDIGQELNIMRYKNGLIITNIKTGCAKEIKYGDLGEPILDEME